MDLNVKFCSAKNFFILSVNSDSQNVLGDFLAEKFLIS